MCSAERGVWLPFSITKTDFDDDGVLKIGSLGLLNESLP